MIGKWNKSVILTYIGLAFAVAGIFLASREGFINYAWCCLMAAGVCDLFDGAVARKVKRTDEEKKFGVELDSLVDVVSFIALPIALFMASGMTHLWDIAIFALFAICGVARLAYFNTVTADVNGPVKFYTGLPVTFSALIFPLLNLLKYPLDRKSFVIVLPCSVAVISLFQILRIKIPKPKGIMYIVFALLAIIMLVVYLVFL